MSCRHIQTQLSEYLDSELPQASTDRVRAHLSLCPECRQEWEELRNSVRLVAHMGGERCPVDLRPGIMTAIMLQSPARPRYRQPMLWSGAVAAAAVALLTPIMLGGIGSRSVQAESLPTGPPGFTGTGPLQRQLHLANTLGPTDGLLLGLAGERADPEPADAEPVSLTR